MEVGHTCHVGEDASVRMFGERSSVDADTFAVRYVLDERQQFLESGRPSPLDGVRTCGDEVVGIFERREGVLFAVKLEG